MSLAGLHARHLNGGAAFLVSPLMGWWIVQLLATMLPLQTCAYGDTNLNTARPIVIAHRGASGYLPEHTEGAKVLAIAQGADYVEQDVVLSRDQILVVSHDITLNDTTNVAEKFPGRARQDGKFYFADFSWSELRTLSVRERSLARRGNHGIRFSESIDQRLVSFEDEIRLVRGLNRTLNRQVGIYVELKSPSWHKQQFGFHMAERLTDVLARNGYTQRDSRCFVQCFEAGELKYLHSELQSPLKLIQLLGNRPLGLASHAIGSNKLSETEVIQQLKSEMVLIAQYAYGIGPSLALLAKPAEGTVHSTGIVEAAHEVGLKVHPYTVKHDDLPDWAGSMDELHRVIFDVLKTDGFFTDFPDIGRRAVDRLRDVP